MDLYLYYLKKCIWYFLKTFFYPLYVIFNYFYKNFLIFLGHYNLYYSSYYADIKIEELNNSIKNDKNDSIILFKQPVIQNNIHKIIGVESTLHYACKHNYVDIIEEALNNPEVIASLEQHKYKGVHLLIISYYHKRLNVVKTLLGCDVILDNIHLPYNELVIDNDKCDLYQHALYWACQYGNDLLADEIMKKNQNSPSKIEEEFFLRTLLKALENKHEDTVDILLKYPEVIEPTLYYACEHNRVDIIEEALKKPKVIENLEKHQHKGVHLVIISYYHGSRNVVETLLRCDVIRNNIHLPCAGLEIDPSLNIKPYEINKYQHALYWACRYKNYSLINEIMIINQNNPVKIDGAFLSGLLLSSLNLKDKNIVDILLKYPEVLEGGSYYLKNILLSAIKHKYIDTVDQLLKNDHIQELLLSQGNTFILLAINAESPEIVTKLLEFKSVQKNEYIDWDTIFLRLIRAKYEVLAIQVWQQKNAVITINNYNSPLGAACFYGLISLVQVMLEDERVVENAACNNNQAYEWARQSNHHDIMRLLYNRCQTIRTYIQQHNENDSENDEFNHKESSMKTLSSEEETELSEIIDACKNLSNAERIESYENLIDFLAQQYNLEPAKLPDGTNLPLKWDEFKKMVDIKKLSKEQEDNALLLYYINQSHSKWRYFLDPNPWMSKTAKYVDRNNNNEGTAPFKHFIPIIAQLWRKACESQNRDLKLNFTATFYDLNRAYNQKDTAHTHGTPDGPDYPNCYWGTKRRILQGARLIANKQLLNNDILDIDINDFVCNYYKTLYEQLSESEQKHLIKIFEEVIGHAQSEESAKKFIDKMKEKNNDSQTLLIYYNTIYPICNPYTQEFISTAVQNDPELNALKLSTINEAKEPTFENDLSYYNISSTLIDDFISTCKNKKYSTLFTEKHEEYVKTKFEVEKNGSHIINFFYKAELGEKIFYQDINETPKNINAKRNYTMNII